MKNINKKKTFFADSPDVKWATAYFLCWLLIFHRSLYKNPSKKEKKNSSFEINKTHTSILVRDLNSVIIVCMF